MTNTSDEIVRHESYGTESAIRDVFNERLRQMAVEGWTPEHDDEHTQEEIARAAACYAILDDPDSIDAPAYDEDIVLRLWPWKPSWLRASNRRQNLVKAGALIIAEIERLDRISQPQVTK